MSAESFKMSEAAFRQAPTNCWASCLTQTNRTNRLYVNQITICTKTVKSAGVVSCMVRHGYSTVTQNKIISIVKSAETATANERRVYKELKE